MDCENFERSIRVFQETGTMMSMGECIQTEIKLSPHSIPFQSSPGNSTSS